MLNKVLMYGNFVPLKNETKLGTSQDQYYGQ